ncbi:hypothetical protein [Noviherbaspirillum cavernae]|uniref:hypothetical protein n=1 Tax=Noviherbaspirillum cavernae TaxID=2320862 RepID=UPI0013147029|nr:hypothetical protein [Noviherbaspirillum cavernae]
MKIPAQGTIAPSPSLMCVSWIGRKAIPLADSIFNQTRLLNTMWNNDAPYPDLSSLAGIETPPPASLPQRLKQSFKLAFHVSNVGLISVTVPPRNRDANFPGGVSDYHILSALACFLSPDYVVQMGRNAHGWTFTASPFRHGLPPVEIQTDRAYTLRSCVVGDNDHAGHAGHADHAGHAGHADHADHAYTAAAFFQRSDASCTTAESSLSCAVPEPA